MFSRINALKVAIGLSLVIAAASAHSASLFFDDFNRTAGTTVGNGWTQTPFSDASIVADAGFSGASGDNAMRLINNPSTPFLSFDVIAIQVPISTIGMTNIEFSFNWKGINGNGPADVLKPQYSINGGANWTGIVPLLDLPLQTLTWQTASFSLLSNADNLSNFGIRFATHVNLDGEGVFIDNVSVTGVAAIPEPEIYAMLGVGLVLIGWAGRKKKLHAAA